MTATPRARVQRRPVHGVLLLDKPLGLSSNQALQKAKWLLRAEKAGHTGTLDPLATGVLPLCFGAATKFSGLHLDADKTYEATLQLGVTTTTGDAEGEVIERRAVPAITPEQLEAVRQRFLGRITQVPPMHSALKKDGKALYEYARAGIEVERAPREVAIHALNLALAQVDQAQAAIKIEVTCSKGTYIRTLGEDIGQALGCGGHLTRLRRTATGPFVAAQCTTLPALEALDDHERLNLLQPAEALLPDHTAVTLAADDAAKFLTGLRRRGDWVDADRVVVFGDAPRALLGSAHIKAGELIPSRLLSPIEIRQILQAADARLHTQEVIA
ncbi:MAG TPA: tRNA pseudouridine(55) synthase TruB [Ottowia sp.]|uniref:tRNA pseudouridine(55) synthase TruB n=1 Tax=Ottowia sp. TaxID=1898956 RepID=UPI001B668915|nr:tRNA pseudouridine(55) synthase TruB [Ottowia sp.]MBP8862177.1 tRNA pseudouridine(55) synthase TruB [Ottowia sp.]MBP8929320.1 tRNA pseudouridine(55) synthase TruB [Ottowia sp.]HRN08488.1 tRNA pseudouridine(55) synthase TruB [Ottowia sp.]